MSNEILDKGRRKFIGASLVAVPGAAVVSSGLLASGEASAQTKGAGPAKEPMVIGYPNKKGIQIERVTYPARNMGTEIAAYIFKPAWAELLGQLRQDGRSERIGTANLAAPRRRQRSNLHVPARWFRGRGAGRPQGAVGRDRESH